jgi:hypothetical protein
MSSVDASKGAKFLWLLPLAGILLPIAWFFTHPRVNDAPLLAECRQYYFRARTGADTARIDGMVPDRTGRAQSALTCGVLRRAYPEQLPKK